MKKIVFYLYTLITVFFLASNAQGELQCVDILGRPSTQHELVATNFRRASDSATVEVQSSTPGTHGGQIITLVRSGDSWLSRFATNDYDVQGDPRWFIAAFGEEAASFFGFNIISAVGETGFPLVSF